MNSPDNAYRHLVNVPAVEDQSASTDGGLGDEAGTTHVYQHRKRILAPNPNDPPPDESFAKQSYLYLKITYDPDIVGNPDAYLPRGLPSLPPTLAPSETGSCRALCATADGFMRATPLTLSIIRTIGLLARQPR